MACSVRVEPVSDQSREGRFGTRELVPSGRKRDLGSNAARAGRRRRIRPGGYPCFRPVG
jgi:hypothetical protein